MPGTWEKMTCVVEVLRPDGEWCAIPSEVIPPDVRGVLESQAVLLMNRSMHEDFINSLRKLRSLSGLLQDADEPEARISVFILANRR